MSIKLNRNRLRAIPLFRGLKDKTLDFLIGELSQCFFSNGTVISEDNERADSMFIIMAGNIAIEKNDEFLAQRVAGEVIGEQALIDSTVRSATMIARGSVELLKLDRDTFKALTEMDGQFSQNTLEILSEKLRQSTHERGRRFANETRLMRGFREHISPKQLDELLASDHYEDFLEPRHARATIIFSDIRDFTTRAESLEPIRLATELSNYLSNAVRTIHEHGGIVDKFIGDAIMAFWGILKPKDDDVEQAVMCGLKLIENASHFLLDGEPIRVGVGIASGEVFYGHIGDENKRQLTVLGDPVNVASRLETETKYKEIPILMDAGTASHVKHKFPVTPIGPLHLKGKTDHVESYTLEQFATPTSGGVRCGTIKEAKIG